ncbi:MAG: hypothetical protein JWN17_647, partial [Frankiales bacterium]|nr:hypothetical protein [Frankiales bacterium]
MTTGVAPEDVAPDGVAREQAAGPAEQTHRVTADADVAVGEQHRGPARPVEQGV